MSPIRLLLITTAIVAFTASAVWKPQNWKNLIETIEEAQDRLDHLDRHYCVSSTKVACRLLEDDRVFLNELRGEISDQMARGEGDESERVNSWSEKLRDFLMEFRQTEIEIRSSRR